MRKPDGPPGRGAGVGPRGCPGAARVLDVWEWPVTLGRAMDNNVVLDDAFVAPHHARLTLGPAGRVQLQVLNTANGVRVDGRPHAAGATVDIPAAGAMLQLGANSLRLRLPDEDNAGGLMGDDCADCVGVCQHLGLTEPPDEIRRDRLKWLNDDDHSQRR